VKIVLTPKVTKLLVWLSGFLVAFFWNVYIGFTVDTFPDGAIYVEQARELNNFFIGKNLDARKIDLPLGLSILVYILGFIPVDTLTLFKIVQCVFYATCLTLSHKILEVLKVSGILHYIILSCFALDPFMLSFTSGIQSEIFAACAVLLWTSTFLDCEGLDKKNRRALTLHFYSFFIVVCRPNYLFLYIIFLVLIFGQNQGYSKKSLARQVLIFFSLPLAIFHLVTYFIYNGFIFLSVNGPINLYLACQQYFMPQILGIVSSDQNFEINQRYFTEVQQISLGEKQGASVYENYSILKEHALSACEENLLDTAWLSLARIFLLWRPFLSIGSHGTSIFLVSVIVGVPLFISFLWVLIRGKSFDHLRRFQLISLSFAISLAISLLPSAFQLRHKIAAFESIQWICLGVLLNYLIFNYKNSLKNKH